MNFSHCLSCFACNCSLQVRYLASIWKNRGISHKAYPGCSVNVELFLVAHWFVTTQANNDKHTCFTMAGCHTVLTPIEKQSGQQVLYACHLSYLSEWVEDIMLSNQYTTCSTTVWFILKQTHEEMRVPSCGGRHELQWKVVLGTHTSSTAHWHALYSYNYEWRITEREHKFNTGALLQCSKVINPPGKRIRLCSNQSK